MLAFLMHDVTMPAVLSSCNPTSARMLTGHDVQIPRIGSSNACLTVSSQPYLIMKPKPADVFLCDTMRNVVEHTMAPRVALTTCTKDM